jgi:fructan beta-fructosidase
VVKLQVAFSLVVALFAFAQNVPTPTGYDQQYRPQYHFSPRQHWTNDPNGLVYFEGEYHLFFQYNPFGDVWGHMSWGHAVSRDLMHWQELPVALPEENGIMIFTGSTVIDERNSSGFCANGKRCMVAVFTGHTPKTATQPALQTQNLAYSNDRGRTWVKYPGNPVLNLNMADFRDPNVLWSEQGKQWVMAVSLPNDHKIRFYGSPDLKRWRTLSDFGPAGAVGGQWECPDLFELPLDGDRAKSRWVLKVGLNPGGLQGGSGEQYFIGRFDGSRFVNDNPASLTLWTDYGKDCYCALTFNGLPRADPPVMIGWMNNWQYAGKVPTSPWRGQMTVPRKLALRTYAEGPRLVQEPVEALLKLRAKRLAWDTKIASHSFQIESTIPLGQAEEVGWKILSEGGTYTIIGYNKTDQQLFVDRTHSGRVDFGNYFPARTAAPLPVKGPLQMNILVDRCSIEVFAQGGRVAITNLVFPEGNAYTVKFYSHGGRPGPMKAALWSVNSAW